MGDTARVSRSATSATLTLLALLLAADFAFILLHVLYVETRWLPGRLFSLEADGGLPETFQYIKQFWVVLCMIAVCVRTRIKAYAAWALVFAFLMLDDAGQIHEHVGYWLGQQLHMPASASLRPDDFGEMAFAGMIGLLVLALTVPALTRGDTPSRLITRDLLGLTLLLGVAGVVIDALHVIAYMRGSLLAQFLLIAEDGGEMLIMSLLTGYAFHVTRNRGRARFDLRGALVRYGSVLNPFRQRMLLAPAITTPRKDSLSASQSSAVHRG